MSLLVFNIRLNLKKLFFPPITFMKLATVLGDIVPDRRMWAQQALSTCQHEILCCGCVFININCAHDKYIT